MTAEQIGATLGCTNYTPKSSAGQVNGPVATSQGTCSQQGTSYTIAAYKSASDVHASVALLDSELSTIVKRSETIGSGDNYMIVRSAWGASLKPAMVAAVQSSHGMITTTKPN